MYIHFTGEESLEQLNDLSRVTHSQEVMELRCDLESLTLVPVLPCSQFLLSKGPCFQPFGPFVAPVRAHESKKRVPDPRVANPRLKKGFLLRASN